MNYELSEPTEVAILVALLSDRTQYDARTASVNLVKAEELLGVFCSLPLYRRSRNRK